VQRRWFHDQWLADQNVNQMLVHGMSRPLALLLGLSAGVGEEISVRGALQPRLGLFMSSLLFASLHVQYSWIGMLVILGLGWCWDAPSADEHDRVDPGARDLRRDWRRCRSNRRSRSVSRAIQRSAQRIPGRSTTSSASTFCVSSSSRSASGVPVRAGNVP